LDDRIDVRRILFSDDPPADEKTEAGKSFQEALKPGAKVVTTSGMHGTIFSEQ
jgi:preprotein translocase subunit YajC